MAFSMTLIAAPLGSTVPAALNTAELINLPFERQEHDFRQSKASVAAYLLWNSGLGLPPYPAKEAALEAGSSGGNADHFVEGALRLCHNRRFYLRRADTWALDQR
jgi:hypothetical protein